LCAVAVVTTVPLLPFRIGGGAEWLRKCRNELSELSPVRHETSFGKAAGGSDAANCRADPPWGDVLYLGRW